MLFIVRMVLNIILIFRIQIDYRKTGTENFGSQKFGLIVS